MIRYELKDKERQAAFEKVLPGFDEALQQACAQRNGELEVGACVGLEHFQISTQWCKGEWTLALPTVDLEVIGKYDSKKWNKFPEVTPPEGVWMRVEGDRARGFHVKHGAIFLRGEWYWRIPRPSDPDPACAQIDRREVERFRPWDEEEEK